MPDASLVTQLSKATNIPEESILFELNKAINPLPVIESDDPSIDKMKDLQKMADDPPRLPGLDILTLEPKLTIAATKFLDTILNTLTDPELSKMLVDNITKTFELNLENKLNKIEYLKNDTKHVQDNKDNSTIINNIHNETVKPSPFKVSLVKGGSISFFTEEECSFF
jgi:hypothetical protein